MKKTILIIFLLLYAVFLNAQHPTFIHLSEKDGLPDVEFYDVLEDANGFIWLAADKGLYRYDGKEFKRYTNDTKKRSSVFGLMEDDKGRIWCTNISGQYFYIQNDKLITFFDLGDRLKGQLGDFLVTPNFLIINGLGVLYKIDLESKKIQTLVKTLDLEGAYLSNKEFYFFDKNDIVKMNFNGVVEEKLHSDFLERVSKKRNLVKKSIQKIGDRFFITSNEIRHQNNKSSNFFLFDIHKQYIKEIALPEVMLTKKIVRTKVFENELWFLTEKGIHRCELKGEKIYYKGVLFSDEYVTGVIKDKNRNYWVSTHKNGVFVIPNIHVQQYELSLRTDNVSFIEKIDEEKLFFGTSEGEIGTFNTITNKQDASYQLIDRKIQYLLYNKGYNEMYISFSIGGYVLDFDSGNYQKVYSFGNAKGMAKIDDDRIIYASYGSANIIKRVKEGNQITFRNKNIGKKRCYTAHYQKETDKYYVAYVDNLKLQQEGAPDILIQYQEKPIYAVSITETANNIVWVSTHTQGIYGIVDGKVVINYKKEDGLISNEVSILKADGNDLWISTDKGIQLLDTENKTFQTLTKRDGILSYDISRILIQANKVFFASNKGLFSIDKEKVFNRRTKSNLYFTSVEINEQTVPLQDEYELEYNQNAIKFLFNANGFQSKEHVQYKTRLLGFNEKWVTLDRGIDLVKYNSLPIGDYTFQVKATSYSSEEDSLIAQIQFKIKSPFWKKAWFIISAIALLLSLIIIYYRTILKKREKEKNVQLKNLAKERELVFLKLENLRSQMNPHFIFNALNSIQEYIILNKKNLASDYLGKFADLIRIYLNHSNKGIIYLQEELDCLERYLELEELRFEDKLEYKLSIDTAVDVENIMIPTMLIQPYVENALKHGLLHKKDNRKLSITLKSSTEEYIVCIIEDNGIGRGKASEIKARKEKTHQSLGIQVTQDRLNLLNYGKEKPIGVTIEDLFEEKTQKPKGTRVVIAIPISNLT